MILTALATCLLSVSIAAAPAGESAGQAAKSATLTAAATASAQSAAQALSTNATTAATGKTDKPEVYAIHAWKVVTMDETERVLNNATVVIADGRFVAVGKRGQVEIPADARVIDASDKWVTPGLIDGHDHSAANLWDLNDSVYLTNLGLRALDAVEPDNERMKDARAGGVTTVLVIPGSGTNMSGFGTVVRTAGETTDEVVAEQPGCLKMAQAGNPEWYWYGVGRSFMNYNLRQTLEKARAYHQAMTAYENGERAEKPQFNPMFDDFRGLFRRDFPTLVHTQIYQVLMKTLEMVPDDFGLWTILGHCTFDAYKLASRVDETRTYTCNGPRQYHFDRQERRMNGNAARWWQGGVRKLSVNTDAPVVPQEELSYQATMACWYGWEPYPALKGLTKVASETLGVADRMGSIEPGKHANLTIWTGDPIDPRSSCELTFVNGEIVYDASIKRRF